MKTKRRYNDFTYYIKNKFNFRVQKVSINAGFTCPNKDGSKGTGGCTYCNNNTFNPDYCKPIKPIIVQIQEGIEFFSRKYNSQKYLAYFQAFTNTYAPLSTLKKMYEEALSHKDVIGLVMGKTISEAAMKLASGKIVIAEDDALEHYDPVKYASIVSQVVEQNNATRVLMGATTMGKDLGPRVAAELGWGYLGDCLEATNEGFVRPNYAGKVLAKSNPDGPLVASIRSNAYPVGESWSGSIENFSGSIPDSTLKTASVENPASSTFSTFLNLFVLRLPLIVYRTFV